MSSLALAIDSHAVGGPSSPDQRIMALAGGFKSWTAPFPLWPAAVTFTPGSLYTTVVWIDAGQPITKITSVVGAAASGVTLARWGIYSNAGVKPLLASTADVTSQLGSAAVREFVLSAPWVPPTSTWYLCGLLQVGTTPATFPAQAPSNFVGLAGSFGFAFGIPSLSDLPANMSTAALTNRIIHFGLS